MAFALLVQAFTSPPLRRLSYEKIAGYEPNSDVTQHNRLDLDQKEMEDHLKVPDFAKAKAIYEKGAHSGAYARLTVNPLPDRVTPSSIVVQARTPAAKGYIKKEKGSGATEIDVTYTSPCVDNTASKDHNVAGCYTKDGPMTVKGTDIGTPTAVVNKYRTLAGFSTAAGTKMVGQATFEKFKKYYTNADYGHRYVTAALDGSGIFVGKDNAARIEGAKKGSAYMNVWMYTIREMEDAIADCKADCIKCNDDPVHAWDEAVAFYTGTLEGQDGQGSGRMLYALADKRCQNFKTCSGGTILGLSEVNAKIMELFKQGKARLLQSKCSEVKQIRDDVIAQMSIPLIQGALRYAYKIDKLQGGSKEKAEGAVFAAAILPMVHACSATAAETISKNLKIDNDAPMADGFAKVKSAFESTYTCLGITCQDVGGLLLGSKYYDGAEQCGAGTEEQSNSALGNESASAIVFALVVGMMILVIQ